MQLRPVNENEAVLETYWNGDKNADDSRIDVLAPYRILWPGGSGGSVRAPAFFTIVRPAASGPALVLERDCDLLLDGYDRLVLSASVPAAVCVTIEACLDGTWRRLVDAARGSDRHDEIAGAFTGQRLRGLRISFDVTGPVPAAISLNWLLAADSDGVARMLARRPVLDPQWPGLLEPDILRATPQLGLFFGPEALPALRRKFEHGHLRVHYQALLERAESLLALRPEDHVGTYAPGGDPARGLRVRDLEKPGMTAGTMDVLAFAGILENDERYSRMAARMALALAHCDHWVHSFMGALSGTTSHPRCFDESYYLRVLPLVLDWAGHCLTPAGRELIRDAMIMKGLARVESDFRRWSYIREMNQGLLFTPGRVRAYLALVKTYPRYRANVAEAERDMHAMLNNYLQADGGTTEGMGYWHSVGEVFPTLFELVRYRGKPFSEGIGARICKTADYALAMLSTAGDGRHFLPINAAGHAHKSPGLSMAAVFAAATGDDAWRSLHARLCADAEPQVDWFHLLIAPDAGVDSAPAVASPVPGFYYFPATGHAGVVREGEGVGRVRLHVFSGPTGGGHSHQDKGSFILEAAGETLAMDRGTTNYNNPAHLVMCKAAFHNLVVPEDAGGTPLEQQPKTTPGGCIVRASFADGTIGIECDNRRAWEPGLFRRNRRRIWSPAPELFVVDDDLALRAPHVVGFRLHSAFAMQRDGAGAWVVKGTRSCLRIVPVNWVPASEESREAGIDHDGRPVNLLRLATRSGRTHRLLTLLEVGPADQEVPVWQCRWDPSAECMNLTARNAGRRYKYVGKG